MPTLSASIKLLTKSVKAEIRMLKWMHSTICLGQNEKLTHQQDSRRHTSGRQDERQTRWFSCVQQGPLPKPVSEMLKVECSMRRMRGSPKKKNNDYQKRHNRNGHRQRKVPKEVCTANLKHTYIQLKQFGTTQNCGPDRRVCALFFFFDK